MTVAAGQKLKGAIRAADWNDLLSMLGQWRANGRRIYFPDAWGKSQPLPGGWCWIKNNHTSDVAAFGVLGLDGPVIDFTVTANAHEKFNGVRLKGVNPSTSTPHYGQYAVLQEPAKASGGFARAVIFGPAVCKLSITHAADRAAEIENSTSTHLKTGYCGTSRVLWKQSGTGTDKLGIIRIGETLDIFYGKPTASKSVGATDATIAVWKPNFSGSALGPEILNVIINVRDMTTSTKVVGNIVDGIANAFPKDCEDE